MEDEEYKESEISKKVKELMDDGYEFGEAVREALKEGFADGGSIGIEVLFKPKRQELFMGGPALTGPALNIYNSMKAYDAFTDQEIADAIKEAGYRFINCRVQEQLLHHQQHQLIIIKVVMKIEI